jgi:hypothetical protein
MSAQRIVGTHGLFSHINDYIKSRKVKVYKAYDVKQYCWQKSWTFRLKNQSEHITDDKENDFSIFAEISSSGQWIGTYFKLIAKESFAGINLEPRWELFDYLAKPDIVTHAYGLRFGDKALYKGEFFLLTCLLCSWVWQGVLFNSKSCRLSNKV